MPLAMCLAPSGPKLLLERLMRVSEELREIAEPSAFPASASRSLSSRSTLVSEALAAMTSAMCLAPSAQSLLQPKLMRVSEASVRRSARRQFVIILPDHTINFERGVFDCIVVVTYRKTMPGDVLRPLVQSGTSRYVSIDSDFKRVIIFPRATSDRHISGPFALTRTLVQQDHL